MYNIIAYGISGTLERNQNYIEKRFRIVGYSDTNTDKAAMLEKPEMYILPMNLLQADFDYIFITSIFDKEIKESLMQNYQIPEEKILMLGEWQGLRLLKHFGDRNPDKTFYILSRFTRYRDGLFSHIFLYLEQLAWVDKHDVVPVVDMMNYRNQYLEEDKIGLENAWEYYFEPLSDCCLKDVYESRNVFLGYDKELWLDDYQQYDLEEYSRLWKKYIRLKPDIEKKINDTKCALFQGKKRILGVLFRGTDYNALKLNKHAIQPDIQEMFEKIDAELLMNDYEGIFVSTESQIALDQFREKYGCMVIYTNQQRFSDTGTKWLSDISFERENDKYLRGYEYLETIMILSQCTSLIAGICYGSVCVKIINDGKYETALLIEKGAY